jgi:uncharacterized RDD family membrane protein YckC
MLVDDRISIATPEGVDVELVLAGLGSRFLARLLDLLIQGVLILALGTVVAVLHDQTGDAWLGAISIVGVFLVIFVYDVLFEMLAAGRTPGKRAAGIRVVGLHGEPERFLASAIRNVLRIIEYIFFYIPAIISIVLTKRDQRIGDLAAGTIVIRERFGGGGSDQSSWTRGSAISVPAQAVMTWDVSAVTDDEMLAIRQFLDRRLALPWHVRAYLANELIRRVVPHTTGIPPGAHPEYILEGILVAKYSRA